MQLGETKANPEVAIRQLSVLQSAATRMWGPQTMVDDPRICAAGKSDRLMGVCVHPMAQPRLGRWPAGDFYCDQFWFCNAMPPEWHWVMPLGMPLLLIIIVAVPVANILHRAAASTVK
jgi:hypothetical protein